MNRVAFDPAAWKAATPLQRYDLAWDLVHRDVLLGKSSKEVIDLLGETEMTETLAAGRMPFYDPGPNGTGTTVWYYNLGYDKYGGGFGPSGALLAVDFRNEKVVGVRKVVH